MTASRTGQGRIQSRVDQSVGWIVIDNPAKRNALSSQMCLALIEAIELLSNDQAVKVIALTGAGTDFSAGVDISELPEVLFDQEAPEGPQDHLSAVDMALSSVSKPTFALVAGICMGGAWQLASACDVLLACTNTRLAITPAKLGIIYPQRGVERLLQRVGLDRAKYLLFSGNEIPAALAERWGLFTELIPEDSFQQRATELLQTVARRSQFTIHTMKALIDPAASTGVPAADAARLQAAWQAAWLDSVDGEDFKIGRRAFLAGEVPEFRWQPAV
ncbi:hypothetical protein UM93_12685 [Psychromicrobium lacuslunae]|uniref:Enoyl-CoA hydratase n=1 Tax=Psychromicrobium lacuslunae TaxID=1618207 RepID=A0A0D4C3K7_9MICC|nr:hypothetical protein UM93_12685 [Psychromicrobium lacuslunae]